MQQCSRRGMAEKKSRVEQKLPNEGAGDKKWAKRRVETYKIYIFKMLKPVHQDIGISRKAMGIMNSFIFNTRAQESLWLMHYNQKPTITSWEI
ncbi:hypothetical protein ACJRO7_030579 [Eucalyptus globulus]|uniref:Histone H2B n=1 Tax=Eucalyptus globulus TaxID=34317 RepID=A0ABD3JHP2_EUCGL